MSRKGAELCPNSDAPHVIFLNLLICGTLLALTVRRLQLALDGEATLRRLGCYSPLLLLVAHDGDLIVWLPWTETQATRILDGFPDVPAVEFTCWCTAFRKIPIFVLQTRELWYLQHSASPLNVGFALLSGLNLLKTLVHRGLQVVAIQRIDINVAIVSVDRLRESNDFDTDEFRGAENGSLGPGFSLINGTTEAGADQGLFENDMQNPLVSSDGRGGVITERGHIFAGTVSEDAAASSSRPIPRRPIVGSRSHNNRYARAHGLFLLCIGVGMPLLICFNKMPSDALVESIIVWIILCLLGLIVIVALVVCVLSGGAQVGKRKFIRHSFLDEREEEIERQREEIQRRDDRAEYVTRQLHARGIVVEEYHRLSEAKQNYEAAWKRLADGDESAEADVTKWSDVLSAHPERIKEVERENQDWADREMPRCHEALELTRSFVPTDVRQRTLDDLISAGLPRGIARRILRNRTLWLCVLHSDDIARLHKNELLNEYAVTGCDIVEIRSIFAKLPPAFSNDPDGGKEMWRRGVREKLKEMVLKEESGTLTVNEARNQAYRSGQESRKIVGPFNPREPLMRRETVKSSAFEPTTQPTAEDGGISRSRVDEMRAKLLDAQQQQQQQLEEEEEPGTSHGATESAEAPTRMLVKLRAEGLAKALGRHFGGNGDVGGGSRRGVKDDDEYDDN